MGGQYATSMDTNGIHLDAVKIKSRMFVNYWDQFVLANINNVYNLIFRNWDQGVVLFKYTIQENEYTFMKRSQTVHIHTSSVIQYGRHLYPI